MNFKLSHKTTLVFILSLLEDNGPTILGQDFKHFKDAGWEKINLIK